ncbi:hypothetical protein SGLAM104S_06031 [Streptomyces glaucescens]
MPATGIRTSSSAICGSAGDVVAPVPATGGRGSGRDGRGGRPRPSSSCWRVAVAVLARRRPAAGSAARRLAALVPAAGRRSCRDGRGRGRGPGRARGGRGGGPSPPVTRASRPWLSPCGGCCCAGVSAFGSLFASAATVSGAAAGAPASAVARRRRRSAGASLGRRLSAAGRGLRARAGRECRSAAGRWPVRPARRPCRPSSAADGVTRTGLGGGAALGLGLGGGLGLRRGRRPVACASLMTSISGSCASARCP